ncbi:MAG: response regulator [Actinobacteria bacterium]|nr:response regulator [Actinomycetota bacterium]MBU1943451.1 response regulator [Actinomycetota bacterium]MBU2686808.1 response regulator [Actinomycetota bacterium]
MPDSPTRILIVEDDPQTAEVMGKLMTRRLAASVLSAPDGNAARRLLAEDAFDIVILDYDLPNGNGLDLLSWITSTDDHPPVIIVTGRGDEQVAAEAFRLRASGYLVKDESLVARLPEVARTAISDVELGKAREALARANEELEHKVRERTEELARANEELRTEVDERRRAEEALGVISEQIQRQAETLDQILSTSPDQFYLLDERGKFIYASRPAAEALGMTQERMAGRYWWDLGMPAEVMEKVDIQREKAKNTGEAVMYETAFPTVRGIRDFEYILTPIPGEDGRVTTVVATVRDVTDRDRAGSGSNGPGSAGET